MLRCNRFSKKVVHASRLGDQPGMPFGVATPFVDCRRLAGSLLSYKRRQHQYFDRGDTRRSPLLVNGRFADTYVQARVGHATLLSCSIISVRIFDSFRDCLLLRANWASLAGCKKVFRKVVTAKFSLILLLMRALRIAYLRTCLTLIE